MELLPMLLLFGLLGVMMYVMTRRQRRAQHHQAELQNSLTVGDRVMTTSGLYGTVVDAEDSATVTIEIAPGVETEWLRAAVREKVGPVEEDAEPTEDGHELMTTAADAEPPAVRDETHDVDVKDAEPSLESGKQK